MMMMMMNELTLLWHIVLRMQGHVIVLFYSFIRFFWIYCICRLHVVTFLQRCYILCNAGFSKFSTEADGGVWFVSNGYKHQCRCSTVAVSTLAAGAASIITIVWMHQDERLFWPQTCELITWFIMFHHFVVLIVVFMCFMKTQSSILFCWAS